jgi:hypothetical protein
MTKIKKTKNWNKPTWKVPVEMTKDKSKEPENCDHDYKETENGLYCFRCGCFKQPKNSWEEEIRNILCPPAPPQVKYQGGVKDWDYYYNKQGMEYMVSKILELFRQAIESALNTNHKEQREELIEGIEKIKKAVARRHGTQKYDSCYNDCIKLLQDK